MNIQTILTKLAGKDVPTELLVNIINRKPTCVGGVVQHVENGKPMLSVHRESGVPTMAQLNEFLKNAQPYNTMLYFGELGAKFNKDDVQPITIDDGDGQPFLCLGIEGDFPKYANVASGRTDEYNYASSILIPSLLDILNLTNGEFDKIVERINEDRFNDTNILSQIGHRGSVTIFPLVGDPIWLGKNELGEAYDWGQCSNRHGYGDVKQEPAPAAPAKSKGFTFAGLTGGKKEASPPPVAAAGTKLQEVAKASVPEVSPKTVAIKVPEWVHKNDHKKTWYQMVAGTVPDRWKNKVPVIPTIPLDQLPKDLSDLLVWEAEQLKKKVAAPVIQNKEPIAAPATATAAPGPKTAEEVKAVTTNNSHPIIGAKDMEKILDFVAKNLDTSANEMPSIESIIAVEQKLGDFTESIGVSPQETLNWPLSGLFALAKLDHRAIVLYAVQMRKLWRDTLKAEDLIGTSKPKSTTTTTKLGESTTKVESVSTEPAPAKKAGGFTFKKVA